MLIVVDTSCISHLLAYSAQKQGIGIDGLDNFVTYHLCYLLTGAYFNQSPNPKNKTSLKDNEKFKSNFIFVGDTKPYWRSEPLKQLGVDYKKNSGRNHRYEFSISLIQTLIESFLAKTDIYLWFEENYEADDLAAYVCKNYPGDVGLLTVDHDWIPLTHRKNVSWINLKGNGIRIYNYQNNMEIFNTNATYKKKSFKPNNILDLWKFKAIYGDKSDNIPGSLDENDLKFLPYIDLYNPPTENSLPDNTIKKIKLYMSTERTFITHKEFIRKVNRQTFALALKSLDLDTPIISQELADMVA